MLLHSSHRDEVDWPAVVVIAVDVDARALFLDVLDWSGAAAQALHAQSPSLDTVLHLYFGRSGK